MSKPTGLKPGQSLNGLMKAEAPIGQTKSGKAIHNSGMSHLFRDYTADDHEDAAILLHDKGFELHSEGMNGDDGGAIAGGRNMMSIANKHHQMAKEKRLQKSAGSLFKAQVDEGKSKEEKVKARSERNDRVGKTPVDWNRKGDMNAVGKTRVTGIRQPEKGVHTATDNEFGAAHRLFADEKAGKSKMGRSVRHSAATKNKPGVMSFAASDRRKAQTKIDEARQMPKPNLPDMKKSAGTLFDLEKDEKKSYGKDVKASFEHGTTVISPADSKPAAPKKPKAPKAKSGPEKTAKEHLQSLPHMGDRSWDRDFFSGKTEDNRHFEEFGEGKHKSAAVDFRNHDYFTSRPHEEDDDNPNFTGKHKVIDQVTRHIGADAKHYNVSAYPQEKGYFTVQLDPKVKAPKAKKTAAELATNARSIVSKIKK